MVVLRNEDPMRTKLKSIADAARKDKGTRFTSLIHHLDDKMLRESFRRLSRKAAPGIDEVTKTQYGEDLDKNLTDLLGRLKQMAYRPQPVLRKYIPKDGSDKMRPLGIPALEDKLVQTGLTIILEQIYEADFRDFSYGFRPNRGCHDALKELDRIITRGRVSYVVDADIRGFFDHVDHTWMMKFLEHRVADTRMLRYINRFLKAGIMEDGEATTTDEGVPQGGSISPLLANIYLHYALDLWFDCTMREQWRGEAYLIRYADDFVACFQYRDDAYRFYNELLKRLDKFGLSIAEEKTKIIEFGRFAAENARRRGERKPATFDFLGFTHYCSVSHKGRFRVKRKTMHKKFNAKVKAFALWLRSNRHKPMAELWKTVRAKLQGHYQYYGVTDNFRSINTYFYHVTRLLFKWLNRRSSRSSYTWDEFRRMLTFYPLPKPRIRVHFYPASR